MKTVATYDGSIAIKSNCKLILGEYYEKDRQCFLMPDGKWHRINNGKIVHDHRAGKKVFISNSIGEGIVGQNEDGTVKIGFFTPDPVLDVITIINGKKLNCISKEIVEKGDFYEELSTGLFYDKESHERTKSKFFIKSCRNRYNVSLDYRSDGLMGMFSETFKKYFNPPKIDNTLIKFLPNVTFGIEYETSNGRIPERELLQNGLIPVRDGSLKNEFGDPYEYATVVLDRSTGIHAVLNHVFLLNKYCENNFMNSMHIHVGSIPATKNYLTAMYMVGFAIQDEIYSMFPEFYRNTEMFKRRNYNQALPKMSFDSNPEKNFQTIIKFLAMDSRYEFRGFKAKHPRDPSGDHKWNVETRYYWLNLTTLIFGKNETVEFRIHPSTFNSDKIINWIFIVSAICEYAKNYQDEIASKEFSGKINLESILNDIYGDKNKMLFKFLIEYIEYRKRIMKNYANRGDKVGVYDAKIDNTDEFSIIHNNHEVKSICTTL